jgi:tetratricopeptide (TPR) repeat protein
MPPARFDNPWVVCLLALLLALPALASAHAQLPHARHAEARTRTERAKRSFEVHNYEAAYLDFARAYELLDGHERRYVVLYNLAVCAERLFRYDEALSYYEQYLAQGGPALPNRTEISDAVTSLRRLLSVVQIDTQISAELWIDHRRSGTAPRTLRLAAGRHVIEVRARQHESVRRELVLDPGSHVRLRLDLVPLSAYRGLERGYFYASAAATGIALLTAISFGAVTLAQREHARELASGSMQLRTPELSAAVDSVSGWALATDLTFSGTALLGVGTLLVYALTDWSDARAAQLGATVNPEIRPAVGAR